MDCRLSRLAVTQPPAFTSAGSASFTIATAGSFTNSTSGFPKAAITVSGALPGGVSPHNNHDGTAKSGPNPDPRAEVPSPDLYGEQWCNSENANKVSCLLFFKALQSPAPPRPPSRSAPVGSFTVTTTGSPAATVSETGAFPAGVTFVPSSNGTAN